MDASKENERRPLGMAQRAKVAAVTAVPVILFSAGGHRFAVEASEVKEVRERDESSSIRKLKGPAPLDFALQVGLGRGVLSRYVVLKPGECWLGVSEIERIASLPRLIALPRFFHGIERQWYRGLLLLENEVIPLIRTDYWRSRTVIDEGSRSSE